MERGITADSMPNVSRDARRARLRSLRWRAVSAADRLAAPLFGSRPDPCGSSRASPAGTARSPIAHRRRARPFKERRRSGSPARGTPALRTSWTNGRNPVRAAGNIKPIQWRGPVHNRAAAGFRCFIALPAFAVPSGHISGAGHRPAQLARHPARGRSNTPGPTLLSCTSSRS